MKKKVPIKSLSKHLRLNEADCDLVRRKLAYSLSRYSDCLGKVAAGVDVTDSHGTEEYRCEVDATVSGSSRAIHVTTRGTSLDETATRAADRTARAIDRTLLEVRSIWT